MADKTRIIVQAQTLNCDDCLRERAAFEELVKTEMGIKAVEGHGATSEYAVNDCDVADTLVQMHKLSMKWYKQTGWVVAIEAIADPGCYGETMRAAFDVGLVS